MNKSTIAIAFWLSFAFPALCQDAESTSELQHLLSSPNVTPAQNPDVLFHWKQIADVKTNGFASDATSTKNGIFFATPYLRSILKWSGTGPLESIPLGPVWSIAYGGGTYVAGGDNGALFSSTDAISWQPGTPTGNFFNLAYGNGLFLARDGSGYISRSTNGINWTRLDNLGPHYYSLIFGGGFFLVGGGQLGFSDLIVTPDGIHGGAPLAGTTNSQSGDIFGLTYGHGVYVASTDSKLLLYSNDAINWSRIPDALFVDPISFTGGTFIGIYEDKLVTSPDGLTWLQRDVGLPARTYGFVFGEGRFFAYGQGGIFMSDLVNQITDVLQKDAGLISYVRATGLLGAANTLQSSPDLQTWTDLDTITNLQGSITFRATNSIPQRKQFFRTVLR